MSEIKVSTIKNEELKFIAGIHMESFKGYMNAMLGKRYVRNFIAWFIDQPQCISIKAELDGSIAGYLVGAPIGYEPSMNSALMSSNLLALLTHPRVILHPSFRYAIWAKLRLLVGLNAIKNEIRNPEGKGISLVGIGVAPENSRKGVGDALIREFELLATKLGFNFMRLSVYRHNNIALNFYKKNGWLELQTTKNVIYLFKPLIQP
jgi:ribosomal protein S18 acetylase RimI-like enzyme